MCQISKHTSTSLTTLNFFTSVFSVQLVSAHRLTALFHINIQMFCLACLPGMNFYQNIQKNLDRPNFFQHLKNFSTFVFYVCVVSRMIRDSASPLRQNHAFA